MSKVIRVKVEEVIRRNLDPRLGLRERSYCAYYQEGGWFTERFPSLCEWKAVIEPGHIITMHEFATLETAKRHADSLFDKVPEETEINLVYRNEIK